MQQALETIWVRWNKPRTEAATKQGVERKRDREGCSVGDGHTKNLRPRKGLEGAHKERRAPEDIRGTALGETDPHTGNMTEQRRNRQIRAQGTKIIRRRNAIMQRKIIRKILANEWRGYNIVNTRSFYGSFQAQKNYPLAKYIFAQ